MNRKTRKLLLISLLFALVLTLYDVVNDPNWMNIGILILETLVIGTLGLSLWRDAETIVDDGVSAKITQMMHAGRQAEARMLAEEEYYRSLEQFGAKHVNTIFWACNYCRVLQRVGETEQTKEILYTVRQNLAANRPKNRGLYGELLRSLAELFINEKLVADATPLLDEAEKNLNTLRHNTVGATPAQTAQRLAIDVYRIKILALTGDTNTARTKGWHLYEQAKTSLGDSNVYTMIIGNVLLEILDDPREIEALSQEIKRKMPTL